MTQALASQPFILAITASKARTAPAKARPMVSGWSTEEVVKVLAAYIG